MLAEPKRRTQIDPRKPGFDEARPPQGYRLGASFISTILLHVESGPTTVNPRPVIYKKFLPVFDSLVIPGLLTR